MATHTNVSAVRPANSAEGNAIVLSDSVTPAAATIADIIRFGPFPAGVKPHEVKIKNADMDTNGTPLLAIKGGYSYKDGSAAPSGADVAFIATASVILQSASGVAGNNFLIKPFEIQKEWYLDLVVTASAATFAAVEVTAVVVGEAVGAK